MNSRLFLDRPFHRAPGVGLRERVPHDLDVRRHAVPDANRRPTEHHVLAGALEVVVAKDVGTRAVHHQHRLRIAPAIPEPRDWLHASVTLRVRSAIPPDIQSEES